MKFVRSNIFFAILLSVVGLHSFFYHRTSYDWHYRPLQEESPTLTFEASAPTERFRGDHTFAYGQARWLKGCIDNLDSSSSYITCWSAAGFTNEFMAYVNMIYLATLTDRIPIIPPFYPSHHISASARVIPFGDLFDLNYLQKKLQIPILEWRDVKKLPSRNSSDVYSTSEIESLGCWTAATENNVVQATNLVHHLGLDISYTRLPDYTRYPSSDPKEAHIVFSQLAALIYPKNPITPPESFKSSFPSPLGHSLTPDANLSCFDFLYFLTSGAQTFEWMQSWSPAWRTVGQHLYFTPEMNELGIIYLKKVFRLPPHTKEIPPFIVVHIRRGDFAAICRVVRNKADHCLPPVSFYAKSVDELAEELKNKNLAVSQVIVSSDEIDSTFWDEVKQLDWKYINHTHEQTIEKYGEWYLPFIDIVIQSHAIGFVGTHESTFSLLGMRRVRAWNRGVTRSVSLLDVY